MSETDRTESLRVAEFPLPVGSHFKPEREDLTSERRELISVFVFVIVLFENMERYL